MKYACLLSSYNILDIIIHYLDQNTLQEWDSLLSSIYEDFMTGLSLLIICMQQQSSLLAAASGPAPYRNHEWAAAAQLPAAPSVLVPVTFVWLPTSPTTTIRHSYTTVNNIVSTTFIFFDCQENSMRIRPCLKFIKNQIEIIRIHRSHSEYAILLYLLAFS